VPGFWTTSRHFLPLILPEPIRPRGEPGPTGFTVTAGFLAGETGA